MKRCFSLARWTLVPTLAFLLAGCAVTPVYERPAVETPLAFKEGRGEWVRAAPADGLDRGPWWGLFDDPVLDGLASRIDVSNQNVAAAVAGYAQARAIVAEQRAALFPLVTLDANTNRTGGGGKTPTRSSYQVSIGAAWEPDVWGRLGSGVEAAGAGAQASYQWSPQWATYTYVEYQRLTGDVANSPLVSLRGTRDQLQFGVGVSYSFDMKALW